MAKLMISKVTGDDEQTAVEIEIDFLELPPGARDNLLGHLRPYYKLMDDRVWEMNKRVIAANYLCKQLPAEAQMAIHNMMDVLHGRKPAPSLELVLQEATEELLAQREAAGLNNDDLKQPSDA